MLLNNQQITEEIEKEIKICIEMSENENTTTQNLWDTIKAVLRGKFIAIQAYLRKQEKSQINNLTVHLKQPEKKEIKPSVSRRKEIFKFQAEIIAKETKETIAKINKAKSWFCERINKIDKPIFDRPISLMNRDANILNKILAIRINNTLKRSYKMTEWALSQGCKDSSISTNQSM